jgi:two-component system sensor histidine kinase RegB
MQNGILFKVGKSIASFFQFPSLHSDSELAKLAWLVRLRWIAILLFFCLTGPAYLYGFLDRATMPIFIGIVSLLLIFNLMTYLFVVERKKLISPLFICFQLTFDLVVLSGLLTVTNGYENPFIGLFLLNVSLGGILITGRLSWPFLALTHTILLAMQIQFVHANDLEIQRKFIEIFAISHLLIFSFWIVMRSLGSYFEQQTESQLTAKINLEKQDRLRAVGALSAGFSHEFASPLNAAKLRLERLSRQLNTKTSVTTADELENINEALAAINQCEQVIHQMNSSQLDTRDFQFKMVNGKDLLDDIIDSWLEDHPAQKVIRQIQDKIVIQVPPINFAQVVLNLLDNAFEASSGKEITIYFNCLNDKYVLQVMDQGSGFAAEVLKRMGEPFVTSKKTGTGLGLYVSQLFIQSLSGEIKINNKNIGASVELIWPQNFQGQVMS